MKDSRSSIQSISLSNHTFYSLKKELLEAKPSPAQFVFAKPTNPIPE
jgi:hypothetical protein